MSKPQVISDTKERQSDMFLDPDMSRKRPGRGDLDIHASIREWLGRALARCRLSREEVAAKISILMDREGSLSVLNAWTAESKNDYRIPAEALPAVCHVLEDYEGLELPCSVLGGRFIAGDELREVRLFKLREERERLEKQIDAEEQSLGIRQPTKGKGRKR